MPKNDLNKISPRKFPPLHKEVVDPAALLLSELRQRLRIDRNGLDDEIEEQADLFYRAAEAHALAVSRRDEAKAAVDDAFTMAADKVRRKAGGNGEKITEAAVKEAASQDNDFNEATTMFLESKKNADLLGAMRDAVDMRGKMLRELAQLYISGYFSIVGVGGATRSKINEDAGQRARQVLNEKRMQRVSK